MPAVYIFLGAVLGYSIKVVIYSPYRAYTISMVLRYGVIALLIGVLLWYGSTILLDYKQNRLTEDREKSLQADFESWKTAEEERHAAKLEKIQTEQDKLDEMRLQLAQQKAKIEARLDQEWTKLQTAQQHVHEFCYRAAEVIGKNSARIVGDLAKRNPSIAARRDEQNRDLVAFFNNAPARYRLNSFRRHEKADEEDV